MSYLTQGLHRAQSAYPHRTAIAFEGRSITYAQLYERVSRLASGLVANGVRPGDRVAMLSLNQARFIEYYLAVYWCGAVVNPVNTRWTAREIAYSLVDSETRRLIVDRAHLHLVEGIRAAGAALDWVMGADDHSLPGCDLQYEEVVAFHGGMKDVRRGGSDIAGIFYTGGTTGFPKGVMLSHDNLFVNSLTVVANGYVNESTVWLHVAPMFHLADTCFTNAMFIKGGTHVISAGFSPAAMFDLIARHRCTDTMLVPAMIVALLDAYDSSIHDFSSLRGIAYGASAIGDALLMRLMKHCPGIKLRQGYGQTELGPIATYLSPEDHSLAGSPRLKSAGTATLHAEIRIVNQDLEDVPVGQVGEILVRGPGVMLGYWKKPEETQKAIVDGWLRTGDGGKIDEDGYLYVVDRLKDMIISGGENIYSAEVENALMMHQAVASCAVIGIPSEKWGESVHAFVVLRPASTVLPAELVEHCKVLIAGYKVPRSIDFVTSLPLSGAGKILKTELRSQYWSSQQRNVA